MLEAGKLEGMAIQLAFCKTKRKTIFLGNNLLKDGGLILAGTVQKGSKTQKDSKAEDGFPLCPRYLS